MLAKQGNTGEARKLFEQAISIRRDDASAINNLGVLYLNIGQANDAIAAFQYGIQVAPDDDILYMNLARIWVRLGERDKARDVMRELLARKPDSAAAQKGLKELETAMIVLFCFMLAASPIDKLRAPHPRGGRLGPGSGIAKRPSDRVATPVADRARAASPAVHSDITKDNSAIVSTARS